MLITDRERLKLSLIGVELGRSSSRIVTAGLGFRVYRFRFCLRVLESIVLITCCKRMEKLSVFINDQ